MHPEGHRYEALLRLSLRERESQRDAEYNLPHDPKIAEMTTAGPAVLHTYLRDARQTLLWKLDGLGEYDTRRPLAPTGTNLLGLVKHSATTEARYFGEVFGRTHAAALPWLAESTDADAEFWAAPHETREEIVAAYRHTWELSDSTISELPLAATGRVPWWGDAPVTLHHVLVHVTAETQRHVGHADILRELIDGQVGLLQDHKNMRTGDAARWAAHRARVEAAARSATHGNVVEADQE